MKITIHVYGKYLHCRTHIAAVVEGSTASEIFKVGEQRVGPNEIRTVTNKHGATVSIDQDNQHVLELGPGDKTITLHSSKSFADLKKAIDKKL